MEWFRSIGQWFIDNKDAIVTAVQGIDIVGIVTAFVLLIKQFKAVKTNTESTNNLNTTIINQQNLINKVDKLEKENEELRRELHEMHQDEELLLTKLNAMLDVQSVVYSTLKDESVRTTVNNILTNAKYNETTTRAKLKEELQSLKALVANKVNDVVDTVEKVVDNTSEIVESPMTVMRG